jgi:hypothetical protein
MFAKRSLKCFKRSHYVRDLEFRKPSKKLFIFIAEVS